MPSDRVSSRKKRGKQMIYGVFLAPGGITSGKWTLTRNKKLAISAARKNNGLVKSVPLDPDTGAYDRTTFLRISEPVAGGDFREHGRGLNFSSKGSRISQKSLDRG